MIRYFFENTPFEFYIFTNDWPIWYLPIKKDCKIGDYKKSAGLGKITICWNKKKIK